MISINKETLYYLSRENVTVGHYGIANVCFGC